MELTPPVANQYVRLAFDQMLAVAERLRDDLVNERPLGPDTNAVAGIVVHCCGVCEFWLGHVGVGRESHRARDDEFSTSATVADLRDLVAATAAQVEADIVAIEAGAVSPYAEGAGVPDRARDRCIPRRARARGAVPAPRPLRARRRCPPALTTGSEGFPSADGSKTALRCL